MHDECLLSHTIHLLFWRGILPQSVKERIKTESNYSGVTKQLCLSLLALKYSSTPYTLMPYFQCLLQLTLHIKEWSLPKLMCRVFILGPFCLLNFDVIVCPPTDSQHRPLSREASLWKVSRPGVAAQLGRHGEELPYPPSKSTINYLLRPRLTCSSNLSLWNGRKAENETR